MSRELFKPGKPTANPTTRSVSSIIAILGKEEYIGRKVLNKTTKDNYKSKKREPNPDGKLVFEGAIPAIVYRGRMDGSTTLARNTAQTAKSNRRSQPINGHPLLLRLWTQNV